MNTSNQQQNKLTEYQKLSQKVKLLKGLGKHKRNFSVDANKLIEPTFLPKFDVKNNYGHINTKQIEQITVKEKQFNLKLQQNSNSQINNSNQSFNQLQINNQIAPLQSERSHNRKSFDLNELNIPQNKIKQKQQIINNYSTVNQNLPQNNNNNHKDNSFSFNNQREILTDRGSITLQQVNKNDENIKKISNQIQNTIQNSIQNKQEIGSPLMSYQQYSKMQSMQNLNSQENSNKQSIFVRKHKNNTMIVQNNSLQSKHLQNLDSSKIGINQFSPQKRSSNILLSPRYDTSQNSLQESPLKQNIGQKKQETLQQREEKIELMFMLRQMIEIYSSNNNQPTLKLSKIVYSVLENLRNTENDRYGYEMNKLFEVIQKMIYCEDLEIIEFSQIYRANSSELYPYFDSNKFIYKECRNLHNRRQYDLKEHEKNMKEKDKEIENLNQKIQDLEERLKKSESRNIENFDSKINSLTEQILINENRIATYLDREMHFQEQIQEKEQYIQRMGADSQQKIKELESKLIRLETEKGLWSEVANQHEKKKNEYGQNTNHLLKENEKQMYQIEDLKNEIKDLKNKIKELEENQQIVSVPSQTNLESQSPTKKKGIKRASTQLASNISAKLRKSSIRSNDSSGFLGLSPLKKNKNGGQSSQGNNNNSNSLIKLIDNTLDDAKKDEINVINNTNEEIKEQVEIENDLTKKNSQHQKIIEFDVNNNNN